MMQIGHTRESRTIQSLRFAHPSCPSAQVEVLRVSKLRERELVHSIYDQTRLNFHMLQLVVDGRGRHILDFESLELEPGSVLHVRPGQVHAFDPASSHEALMAVFLPETMAHPLPRELLRPHRPVVLRPSASDFALMVDLATLLEQLPGRGDSIRSHELAPHILRALVSAAEHLVGAEHEPSQAVPSTTLRLAQNFESLLEDHFGEKRDVTWYAAQLGVSSRTLSRACHAALGTNPKRHIDERLVLEAKRRLIYSPVGVEQISASLRFSEATNFVKFFRRLAGQTPQQFRRQMVRVP